MKLVLLTHPAFFGTVSQPRFAEMIRKGMKARGHEVETWTSPPVFSRINLPASARKWLGYADQYLLFPRELRRRVAAQPVDTLFVITDQALGIWVPQLAQRPHVIHCHDFIALRSALGEFPGQAASWSGKQYQRLIRKGFSQGKAFISVSEKTQQDLHRFLPQTPEISEVVYNGLNYSFAPIGGEGQDEGTGHAVLKRAGAEIPTTGYILHVGGNQWYKNRRGVLEIYRAYVTEAKSPPALWMVGAAPGLELQSLAAAIPTPGKVRFLTGWSNEQVKAAYSLARVLLFPSLEEGFGWPIAEAMASGCPVVTTDAAPMTEVAGTAARLIPRMPSQSNELRAWAQQATAIVVEMLQLSSENRAEIMNRGLQNAKRFDTEKALDAYEEIYARVLSTAQDH